MTDKQFEAYTAKQIQELKDSYNEALQNFKNIGEDEEWTRLYKKILAIFYCSFRYEREFVKWERRSLKIAAADRKLIETKFSADLMSVAAQSYDNIALTKSRDELADPFIDDPESANTPLTDEEREDFNRFLNVVFKPALLDFLKNAASGLYKDPAAIGEEHTAWTSFHELMRANVEISGFVSHIRLNDDLQLRLDYDDPPPAAPVLPLPKLDIAAATYAPQFVIDLTKVGKQLADIAAFTGKIGVTVSPDNKKWRKKPAYAYLTLSPAGKLKDLEFSRPITFFDRSIINAIETLAQNNTHITPATIYQQMNGLNGVKVRPERIADIEARVDYMIGIRATIDATAHLNMNGKDGTFLYEDYLLNLAKATFKLNGQTVTGYIYNKESPLFTYARAVGQIAQFPTLLLDTRSVQKGSLRADTIKHYLLSRIFTTDGQGTTISLETLLKEIGEEEASPKEIRNIREIVEHFLDFWSYGKLQTDTQTTANNEVKAASPICGYTVNQKGRKITGYTLILKESQLKE